jgi:hypothetical protein
MLVVQRQQPPHRLLPRRLADSEARALPRLVEAMPQVQIGFNHHPGKSRTHDTSVVPTQSKTRLIASNGSQHCLDAGITLTDRGALEAYIIAVR